MTTVTAADIELLQPGHPEYEAARQVWNGAVAHRPALIARCRSAYDVARALGLARARGLPVSVRSGGHNTAGLAVAHGGLMIDLAPLSGLTIDPVARVARAGAGLTIGELVSALGAHGLATVTGTCAGTGLGGSTLGGGIGWLSGRHGLGVDNLLAAELVTADGRVLRASPDEHPELFWALRGGGGNFGVVTAMELRLHPIAQVLGGMLVYPLGQAAAALGHYRRLRAAAGDAMGALLIFASLPGLGPCLVVQLCYAGDDPGAGDDLLAPMRRALPPALDTVQPLGYADFFMACTPPAPSGQHYYDLATPVDELSDGLVAALLASAARAPRPQASIVVHELHGAAARVPAAASAFALRRPHLMVMHTAGWEPGPGDDLVAWADEGAAALAPLAAPGLYVNFMGRGRPAEVRAAYGANYRRLAAVKAAYDPANTFHHNQNIPPAQE